jgi:hypothetical protein
MRQLAMSNNTAGASIYDLGEVIQSNSLSELSSTLKGIEDKANAARQEQMQHEQQMKQMEVEQRTKEKQMELDAKALEEEKNRRKDILVAEIKSAGYGAMQDINQNMQSDFQDTLDKIQQSNEFNQIMNFDKTKEVNKQSQFREKVNLEREKLQNQRNLKDVDLQIARENKNKYDEKAKQKNKEKKK